MILCFYPSNKRLNIVVEFVKYLLIKCHGELNVNWASLDSTK